MTSEFTPDYEGIGEMLRSEWMQAEMIRRAEKGKAYAEAIAPFDPTDRDGDHYKDHFSVRPGNRQDRASAELVNDHVAAVQIEWGTSDTPAHRTLGKALDAMGKG